MFYKVMFDYSIPQFTDIEVEAENEDEAREKAQAVFNETYPEALDVVVLEVQSA